MSVSEEVSGTGYVINLSGDLDGWSLDFLLGGMVKKSVFLASLDEGLLIKYIKQVFQELELFSISEKQSEKHAENLLFKMRRALVSTPLDELLKTRFSKPSKSYEELRETISSLDSIFEIIELARYPKEIDESILGQPPTHWKRYERKYGYHPTYDFIKPPYNEEYYKAYKEWHREIFPYGDDGLKRKGSGKNTKYEGKIWTIIGSQWLYSYDGNIAPFHPCFGDTELGEIFEFTIHKIFSGEGFENRDLWSVVWSIPVENKLLVAVYDFTDYCPPRRISYFPEITEQLLLISDRPNLSGKLVKHFVPSPNLSFDFPHIKNRIRELVKKKDSNNDIDVKKIVEKERSLVNAGFDSFPPLQNNPIEEIVAEMVENSRVYGSKEMIRERYPPLSVRYNPIVPSSHQYGDDYLLWKRPVINNEISLIELFWQFSRCIGVTLISSPPPLKYDLMGREIWHGLLYGVLFSSEPVNHAVSASVEKDGGLNFENLFYEYSYTSKKRNEKSPILNMKNNITFRKNLYIWRPL